MVLQGMWVITLIRDEVLWIHETLASFFRTLSKIYKKEEKSAAKKVKIFVKTIASSETYSLLVCINCRSENARKGCLIKSHSTKQ
jgi:hypothetical protein